MTHKNVVLLLVCRTAKLGAVLGVAAMLTACGGGDLNGPSTDSAASVGSQGTGRASSIQSVPANPGSVPNGVGAFPTTAGGR